MYPAPPAFPPAAPRLPGRGGGTGRLGQQIRQEWAQLKAVEWSIVFVGFLTYVFVATTYRLPLGDAAMAVALLGTLVQKRSMRLPPTLIWFGAFVLWSSLGLVWSKHPEAVETELIVLLKLWAIVFVAVNALRSRMQIRLFMILFLVFFVSHPVQVAIRMHLSGNAPFGRAAGAFIYENPNDLAAMVLLHLSIAAALLVSEGKGMVRLGAVVSAVVLPITILLTQSRGAFLGLVVFGLLSLGARARARGAAAVVAIGIIAAIFAPAGFWDRVAGLSNLGDTTQLREVDPEGSAETRWYILVIASEIAVRNPGVGVGVGAYRDSHAEYSRTRPHIPWHARGRKDTHNTYLNVIAETGLLGFLLFMTAITLAITGAERVRRRARSVLPAESRALWYLEAGLFAYLASGLFASVSRLAFLWLHVALLVTFSMVLKRMLAAAQPSVVPPIPASSS